MASASKVWLLLSSFVLLADVPGAMGDDQDTVGALVAAASVAFILLAVVIGMLVAGLTWNNWYPQLQLAKGKVKMPRAYWKKKEEAKLRLLYGSRSGLASLAAPSESGLPNGHSTSRVRDTGSLNASWVQGWNNASPLEDGAYEEMALAMDLGEERDDEIRIETTVVDNEALDLGPFKDPEPPAASATPVITTTVAAADAVGNAGAVTGTSSDQTATMEMTEEPDPEESYIYSTVDKSKKSSSQTAGEVGGAQGPAATSEQVTSFSKLDQYLVAL